jgi:hypothetical protein
MSVTWDWDEADVEEVARFMPRGWFRKKEAAGVLRAC